MSVGHTCIVYCDYVDNDVAAGNTTELADDENVSDEEETITVTESTKDYTNDAGYGKDVNGTDDLWKRETGKLRIRRGIWWELWLW